MHGKWISFIFLVTACNATPNPSLLSFIPGTYVRTFDNEYARGMDTIIIQSQSDKVYSIVKRSGFHRWRNGMPLPKEFRVESTTGVYHEEDEVIEEIKRKRIYHFNVKEKKLLIGNSEYVKRP